MDKKINPAQGEDSNTQRASEVFNRPGSTEHNDYRIGGSDENVSVDKNKGKDSDEDHGNKGQSATGTR